jgi:tetratricopeptide (TPR) repeat protein
MNVLDAWSLSDDQLLRRGRDALRLGRYREACDFLAEYCGRAMRLKRPIPSSVLAFYGLAIGHAENVQDGIEICFQALKEDRRNPNAYFCLARLYVLAGARKNAVDVLSQGLRLAGSHRGLKVLRRSLGVRQARPIPFLPRDNAVNVRLGRVIRKLRRKTPPVTAPA